MVFLQFWPHFQIVPKPPQEFGSISGRSAQRVSTTLPVPVACSPRHVDHLHP